MAGFTQKEIFSILEGWQGEFAIKRSQGQFQLIELKKRFEINDLQVITTIMNELNKKYPFTFLTFEIDSDLMQLIITAFIDKEKICYALKLKQDLENIRQEWSSSGLIAI